MKKHPYVMVDIETLGTHATTAPILEIAAVPFLLGNGNPAAYLADSFYYGINLQESIAMGRLPETDTCLWWFKQNRRPVVNSPHSPLHVMTEFSAWAAKYTDEFTQWFCQGTSFDPIILQDYFDTLLLPTPWKYHQWRDCRTLQKFFGVSREKTASHHPTDDCLNQIASIVKCCSMIQINTPHS